MFISKLLFSILSRPIYTASKVSRIAPPIKKSKLRRIKNPILGLFSISAAMLSDKTRIIKDKKEITRNLKNIPVLIRSKIFRPFFSDKNKAENLVRAKEIPKSLNGMSKEGIISATM